MVPRVIMRYWSRTYLPTLEEVQMDLQSLFVLERLDAENKPNIVQVSPLLLKYGKHTYYILMMK